MQTNGPGILRHAAAHRRYVDSRLSMENGPVVWSAILDEMQAARPFGLSADAVALVLVIGDAVHRGGWFVAMMSCRRVTGRTRR